MVRFKHILRAMGVVSLSFLGLSVAQAADAPKANQGLAQEDLIIASASGEHHFKVELAKTPQQQEIGEMFRDKIAPQTGMLFPSRFPQESEMWMKNTRVPFDIVFISPQRKVESIQEDAVPYSLSPIASHGPVIATLELPGGTAKAQGIYVGDKVSSPTLTPAQSGKHEGKS